MKKIISRFTQKFTEESGFNTLMEDIAKVLKSKDKYYMLGGGIPARIPEFEKIMRQRMNQILKNKTEFEKMIGTYNSAQGDKDFIKAVAAYFNKLYKWGITEENIFITSGSQIGFFYLFNMLAGKQTDGSFKKILFPIAPEYIGYTDLGIEKNLLISKKSQIKITDKHRFKYFIDFSKLKIDKNIAAICISRPTNPTANVITDEEVQKLDKLAKKNNIPLILDNAYGLPFPNILYTKATPFWNKNIILSMSLSKVGLPGTRTGIIIANKKIITKLTKINSIVNVANNNLGEFLTLDLFKKFKIHTISNKIIKPSYRKKLNQTLEMIKDIFDDDIPYYVHEPEGAFFLWLWFKKLPISSHQLYEKLKKQKVIVVPGHYFFPGLKNKWEHRHECIRISYTQKPDDIKKGLKIIAQTVKDLYKKTSPN